MFWQVRFFTLKSNGIEVSVQLPSRKTISYILSVLFQKSPQHQYLCLKLPAVLCTFSKFYLLAEILLTKHRETGQH